MRKKRVKIQRPPNAASNTAFTQISQSDSCGYFKVRVAMDPSDLADDAFDSFTRSKVEGAVIYDITRPDRSPSLLNFQYSCRSPLEMRDAWEKLQDAVCHETGFYLDDALFLTHGKASR